MGPYFADDAASLVSDALVGVARAHADLLTLQAEHGYLRARHPAPARRVAVVSGGGAGHEPLHTGFVGTGMLDAACPGRVFASPHNRQIYEASLAVAGSAGVLHVVKNYTGDRINFGIAAERLAHRGVPCARVLVDDDLATESADIAAGRRGTGGTVLIEKILGAAADTGMGLDELAALGTTLTASCRTLAVASAAHTAPTTGAPAFAVPEGAVEYGVGIHGERADHAIQVAGIGSLVEQMTHELLYALAPPAGAQMIVLVNGLGAVTQLELYGIFDALARHLEARGCEVARNLVGNYVTALDMRGFSLTLLVVDDPQTLRYYDAPVRTAVLHW
ncbi:dihydroxyacetone kinase subunit DhaK [Streptomyces zagrosensis]|uniref:Dihydroxyacetone kinase-like protein n=1 Tax=Streptomyces zagrosensis TaxID=1042984 RepID=A0A7W9UY20_9ACTN|nr:dihydroxyacetone kinase subunit DhaK [Streptomyces zagrosensis]MBB5935493.1 dihydroxyacetone kinase-like protein [Streptomyces zagrosensis]